MPFFIRRGEERRPLDLIQRLARAGRRSGRRRPAGRGAFPAQAQVFGPGTREGEAVVKRAGPKSAWAGKLSLGQIYLIFFLEN